MKKLLPIFGIFSLLVVLGLVIFGIGYGRTGSKLEADTSIVNEFPTTGSGSIFTDGNISDTIAGERIVFTRVRTFGAP